MCTRHMALTMHALYRHEFKLRGGALQCTSCAWKWKWKWVCSIHVSAIPGHFGFIGRSLSINSQGRKSETNRLKGDHFQPAPKLLFFGTTAHIVHSFQSPNLSRWFIIHRINSYPKTDASTRGCVYVCRIASAKPSTKDTRSPAQIERFARSWRRAPSLDWPWRADLQIGRFFGAKEIWDDLVLQETMIHGHHD